MVHIRVFTVKVFEMFLIGSYAICYVGKATITRCDLPPRFFCIDATLLCEFESDKIWINEFQ